MSHKLILSSQHFLQLLLMNWHAKQIDYCNAYIIVLVIIKRLLNWFNLSSIILFGLREYVKLQPKMYSVLWRFSERKVATVLIHPTSLSSSSRAGRQKKRRKL